MTAEPPVLILWYEFARWLLGKTQGFPKRVRFTFSTRLDNLALDVAVGTTTPRTAGRPTATGTRPTTATTTSAFVSPGHGGGQ